MLCSIEYIFYFVSLFIPKDDKHMDERACAPYSLDTGLYIFVLLRPVVDILGGSINIFLCSRFPKFSGEIVFLPPPQLFKEKEDSGRKSTLELRISL